MLAFCPGDMWVGAASWETAKCDWIPLQQDMIPQLDVEYWWEIFEQRRSNQTIFRDIEPPS